MKFNLLDLHHPTEDKQSIELLRVYSVLPKFSKIKNGPKADQAIKVVSFLREIDLRLQKEIAPNWKEDWMKSIGYEFKQSSCKDWFIGRASVPLIAVIKLKEFGIQPEIERLVSNCAYFSSSRKGSYKIPQHVDENLAYLAGAIIGDGHIRNKAHNIRYELNDKELVEKFSKKVNAIFDQKLNIRPRLDRGKT